MKKKEVMRIHVDSMKIPNKMHLDAQIRFPHLVIESKKAYKRSRSKVETRREMLAL